MSNQREQQTPANNRSTASVHKKPLHRTPLTKFLAKRSARNLTERTGKLHKVNYCERCDTFHVEEA